MRKTSHSAEQSPFLPKLFAFLRELKSNNDREWFADNKSRYEQDVLQATQAANRPLHNAVAVISLAVAYQIRLSGEDEYLHALWVIVPRASVLGGVLSEDCAARS